MTKTEFQKKLDEASKIVESWPDWKKNSLKDSFRSRNTTPREEIEVRAQTPRTIHLLIAEPQLEI